MGERSVVLPCLPIPREELRLRPEVLALLREAGIAPEVLVDPGDLDLSSYSTEPLALVLVLVDTDGRELPEALRGRVVEVVDHHPPAGGLPAAVRRIVAPVGSACTLVAEQILQRLPSLLERSLAVLLLGPILLDTVNLDPAAGRVTERDRRAADRLRGPAGAPADRLYEELREARARLEGLTGRDLLRRDFKADTAGGLRFGIASVPVSAQQWLSREPDPGGCLRSFAEERGLGLLAVMFAFHGSGGEFRRQLLMLVSGIGWHRALLGFLRDLPLGLSGLPGMVGALPGSGEWRWELFEQGDVGFSRKRLEPELRRFCETLDGAGHGG